MEKDKKIGELNPLANQAKAFQSRIESQQKDIETLRQKMEQAKNAEKELDSIEAQMNEETERLNKL